MSGNENDDRVVLADILVSDPELMESVLAVFRELELTDQFHALLEPLARWSGASWGVAIGPAGEGRTMIPLATSGARKDARAQAMRPVEPSTLRAWLPHDLVVFEGLGPFGETVEKWPGDPPAHSVVLPVRSPRNQLAGAVMLTVDEPPDEALRRRMLELLNLTRPAAGHGLQLVAMRELIIKDDTASCFNRRYFEEFLPEELSRARRFHTALSLIFLDMDNLKSVNNRFGHAMGSRTLYEVSVRVRAKIRKFDKLFRFGGDEFCIVLPETESPGAVEVAERVREAIGGQAMLLDEHPEGGVTMSASLGVASFPLHARSQKDLIQRADRAMQKVKASGKNGIGVADGDEGGEADGG
ncbi:MAG: GGDEF domain-containing protein [bacterium]|nr:GGDEF domain-containing protein [bacterium]